MRRRKLLAEIPHGPRFLASWLVAFHEDDNEDMNVSKPQVMSVE
jgi:hypothetical protein